MVPWEDVLAPQQSQSSVLTETGREKRWISTFFHASRRFANAKLWTKTNPLFVPWTA